MMIALYVALVASAAGLSAAGFGVLALVAGVAAAALALRAELRWLAALMLPPEPPRSIPPG